MGPPSDLAAWIAGITTRSGIETERAAAAFAQLLPRDTVLALEGNLGVGKTTFVRGLVRGFGVRGNITSPSFSLLNVHEGDRQIFHVDAYRLKDPASFDELLIWDVAQSPWNVVVEWPEKVASRLPKGLWKIKASILADGGHHFQLTSSVA